MTNYQLLATPKLDGIRCLMIDGKAVSRTFKPIPNDYIRTMIESIGENGLDGEILVRNRTFNELSGDVRRSDGRPDFFFAVFDYVESTLRDPYSMRMEALQELSLPDFCTKVLPVLIENRIELETYERDQIALGFEGVMIRTPDSPYKCGRSTAAEGYLLKIKRFEDDEAIIVGVEEMMENRNVATRDAFGRTERSTHKENMVPKGMMGKLVVQWLRPGGPQQFEIGTGFDAATRQAIWNQRDVFVAERRIVKFKHQPSGADEKPRFPVFLGFRDSWDL